MAIRVIEQGLCNVSEYYGIECTLHYPGLYAGQTDMVGVHKGSDAIIDFKQTNKPKREEWIGDYKLQLAAYAMAHNYMHKTEINKGVIMMCSKEIMENCVEKLKVPSMVNERRGMTWGEAGK
jgi:genome maintenance exonuclease 1